MIVYGSKKTVRHTNSVREVVANYGLMLLDLPAVDYVKIMREGKPSKPPLRAINRAEPCTALEFDRRKL